MGYKNVDVTVGGPVNNPPCTYKTKLLKPNLPFADQVTDEDTIYIIKWDFEVGINRLYLPVDFTIGGTMVIDGVTYYWTLLGADADITVHLCDNSVYFCEMNEDVIIPDRSMHLNSGGGIRLVTTRNTYHDRVYYVEANAVEIPNNCVLQFEGGSLNNGAVLINNAAVYPSYDYLDNDTIDVGGYPKAGTMRWDADNGKPLWSNGEAWVDATGQTV